MFVPHNADIARLERIQVYVDVLGPIVSRQIERRRRGAEVRLVDRHAADHLVLDDLDPPAAAELVARARVGIAERPAVAARTEAEDASVDESAIATDW